MFVFSLSVVVFGCSRWRVQSVLLWKWLQARINLVNVASYLGGYDANVNLHMVEHVELTVYRTTWYQLTTPGSSRNPSSACPERGRNSLPPIGGRSMRPFNLWRGNCIGQLEPMVHYYRPFHCIFTVVLEVMASLSTNQ